MRNDGQRRQHSQSPVGQEGGRDDDAVAKVVDAVAHQNRPAAAPGLLFVVVVVMLVAVAFVVMAVPVQLGLLEQEEEQQSCKQRGEQRMRAGLALEGLRQHVQQRGAQQHADRQADHVFDDAAEQLHGHCGCNEHRQHATGQRGEHDVEQRHFEP